MSCLHVITGPMFCGKSEELVRRLAIAAYAQKKILLVKPSIDNREDRNIFNLALENKKLHQYSKMTTQEVESVSELMYFYGTFRPDVLALDEVQFFNHGLTTLLDKLLSNYSGLTIIASGLDMDFQRDPFPIMASLMAMADTIDKKQSVCLTCFGKNGPAIFTQKIGGNQNRIEVGSDIYQPACRVCHALPE